MAGQVSEASIASVLAALEDRMERVCGAEYGNRWDELDDIHALLVALRDAVTHRRDAYVAEQEHVEFRAGVYIVNSRAGMKAAELTWVLGHE